MKQIKISMKYFIKVVLVILSLIIICYEYNRIGYLAEQIKALRSNNDSLRATIERFSFSPIVIPKERVIRLGEEYIADIRLAYVDTLYPPVVLVSSSDISYDNLKDTLIYNKSDQVSTYKVIPTKKGSYTWKGKIINVINGKSEEFLFESGFNVQ